MAAPTLALNLLFEQLGGMLTVDVPAPKDRIGNCVPSIGRSRALPLSLK